jgi:hypothetical protein
MPKRVIPLLLGSTLQLVSTDSPAPETAGPALHQWTVEDRQIVQPGSKCPHCRRISHRGRPWGQAGV